MSSPQGHWSTSEGPDVSCCRVYSQISSAALTCTLSERMTPCWGISTHTSNIWSKLAGMPSRSLLQEEERKTVSKRLNYISPFFCFTSYILSLKLIPLQDSNRNMNHGSNRCYITPSPFSQQFLNTCHLAECY